MANKILKNLITWVLLASLFITGDGIITTPFRLYWYYPVYILFLVYALLNYHRIDFRVLVFLPCLIIYTLLTYKSGLPLVIKQLVNVSMSLMVFSLLLVHENRDLEAIFTKYIKIAKIVAILGFVQVFMFAVGKGYLWVEIFPFLKAYSVEGRLQSVTQEPSYIAFTFAPIAFIALHNIFYRRTAFITTRWSYIFVVTYLFTASTIAFLGIMIIMLLLYVKHFTYRKILIIWTVFVVVIFSSLFIYNTLEGVKMRVDDTMKAFKMNFFEDENYKTVNLSTFTYLTNFYVTSDAVRENPFFGNGLGTYPDQFDKQIPPEMKYFPNYGMNREDAAAMLFRLLAETGIFGAALFIYFVVRHKCRARVDLSSAANKYWLINSGIFVLLLMALLRNGNYTIHGKMLFILMYFYSWMEYRRVLAKDNAAPSAETSPAPAPSPVPST